MSSFFLFLPISLRYIKAINKGFSFMPADNRPVRVGIYGTGRFANQTHLPNLSKLDERRVGRRE